MNMSDAVTVRCDADDDKLVWYDKLSVRASVLVALMRHATIRSHTFYSRSCAVERMFSDRMRKIKKHAAQPQRRQHAAGVKLNHSRTRAHCVIYKL